MRSVLIGVEFMARTPFNIFEFIHWQTHDQIGFIYNFCNSRSVCTCYIEHAKYAVHSSIEQPTDIQLVKSTSTTRANSRTYCRTLKCERPFFSSHRLSCSPAPCIPELQSWRGFVMSFFKICVYICVWHFKCLQFRANHLVVMISPAFIFLFGGKHQQKWSTLWLMSSAVYIKLKQIAVRNEIWRCIPTYYHTTSAQQDEKFAKEEKMPCVSKH